MSFIKKYKKAIYELMVLGLLVVIVLCATRIYTYKDDVSEENNEFNDLKNLITITAPPAEITKRPDVVVTPSPVESLQPTAEPTVSPEPSYNVDEDGNIVVGPSTTPEPKAEKDLKALKEMNNDFVGWLSIEGTKLDYPVMQTNANPDYYLRKNFYGRYSTLGTPYAEEGCNIETPSDNITIYGHNIKDGAMFGSLQKYKEKSYYEDHKYITFETLTYTAKYEIIAVFKSAVYTGQTNEFKYWNFQDAENEEEFNDFITKVKDKAIYDIEETAQYGDKLISLSTCEYSQSNGRLIVVAKMIEKVDKD